ncbi:MAG TPA: hypothetical protein VFX12_05015 [Vicinamibacterales bacterium]|nr:hypothetical protein [Vicinamibacterales bacterium]
MLHRLRPAGVACALVLSGASAALAQVTPAAGYTPPDDTPSVKVGGTIFMDYTYTSSPEATDANGNKYHPSDFDVSRAYINVTGNVSHLVSFRITPDITRVGSGDLELRLKYAFAQINLDDWLPRGTWIRFGQQQTPLIDYQEGIYRYRFQGTTFSEREGLLTSSDVGASFHSAFANNYAEVHAGIYNGEGYHAPEANNQPSLQIRGTVRPFARGPLPARGLRFTGFYDGDHYAKDSEKTRALFEASFEHQYLNAAFDYVAAHDEKTPAALDVHGQGWSAWVTPRSRVGIEGLFRYDHYTPNTSFDSQVHKRAIVGIAYWFPHTGSATSAFLIDYDDATFDNVPQARQRKIAVHALVNF